ncbi:MAG: response regulator [Chitinophagaceae bacterium]|nr:response regulator [Chitinophagaceae bacterium]
MLKGSLIRTVIIDDDEDDYFIIAEYIKGIEGGKFQVDWCDNYREAIEKIKTGAYDIFFIDYRLGSNTGLEILQEAARLDCDAPIVILTGKGNRTIDIAAMQSGATDYLIKSELNTEKLERCIRYSLDRAAALRQLKEREYKYRNLFEGSKDAVFIADINLHFSEVNHAASVLFGLNREELFNCGLFDFMKSPSQKQGVTELLRIGENVTDMEIEIESRNKEIKSCLFSITFQRNAQDKWLVHGIIHDITNLKKAEIANLQAQKLAANERLMRILAHEIRNPLNNISLSIQHFELLPADHEKQKNFVDIIQRNSNRINQSITELLDLTRTGELEFKKYSLQEILNESLAAVEDRIHLQNIKVEKRFEDGTIEISADKPKLKIAFSNILINAIEAMEKNKGKLDVSMTAEKENFTVSIRDNGIGIPEDTLPKLFEPFFTLKKNGMGLGLAASYSILQSHSARIQVESKLNEGTNFIISFSKNHQVPSTS